MDANAKVGWDIIEGDPHPTSQNGQLLLDFVTRNNLIICNASDLREGKIARKRNTVNGAEEEILDYIILCQEMFMFLKLMKIKENNGLTSYSRKKITPSDHRLLIGTFNFPQSKNKKIRKLRFELFNFKDKQGLRQDSEAPTINEQAIQSVYKAIIP